MANQKEQNLKLTIAPDVAHGTYSNLAVISHSPSEITLDFAQMLPASTRESSSFTCAVNDMRASRLLGAREVAMARRHVVALALEVGRGLLGEHDRFFLSFLLHRFSSDQISKRSSTSVWPTCWFW